MAPVNLDSVLYDRYAALGAVRAAGAGQQNVAPGAQDKRADGDPSAAAGKASSGSTSVSISEEALKKAGMKPSGEQEEVSGGSESSELTEEEQKKVDELETTDAKVRAHEQAHMAAGGDLVTRSAQFQYATGPDNKQYAVGGDVQIDVSEEDNPEATLRKANRIRQAALAPAEPSGQDLKVAADAAAMAAKASAEIANQKTDGGAQNNSAGLESAGEPEIQSTGANTGTQNQQDNATNRSLRTTASSAYQQQIMPQATMTFSQRMMSA